jgi:hypothetical protein
MAIAVPTKHPPRRRKRFAVATKSPLAEAAIINCLSASRFGRPILQWLLCAEYGTGGQSVAQHCFTRRKSCRCPGILS